MNRRSFLASVAGFAAVFKMPAVPGASACLPVPSTADATATAMEWDFTAEDFDAFVARRTVSIPAA